MAKRIHRRIQIVLTFAVSVSVAANVLAAEASLVGRFVAALAPIILLLTVDVVGRVPRSSGWLGVIRFAATGLVALVAAIASYSHMHKVALDAGEPALVAWLLPLAVDGLAVVCSAGLYELDRRANQTTTSISTATGPALAENPSPTSVVTSVSSAQPLAANDGGRVVVRSPRKASSTVRPLAPVLTK